MELHEAFRVARMESMKTHKPVCVCAGWKELDYVTLPPPVSPLTRVIDTVWPDGTTTTENFRNRVENREKRDSSRWRLEAGCEHLRQPQAQENET